MAAVSRSASPESGGTAPQRSRVQRAAEIRAALPPGLYAFTDIEADLTHKGRLDDHVKVDTEETFEQAMRQNAMEFDAFDVDYNRELDYEEYSKLVRDREIGIFSDDVLQYRFREMDPDGTGYIRLGQFLLSSLREAVERSATAIAELFAKWDEDDDKELTKVEFRKALRSLGFQAGNEEFDHIFDEFDDDKDGIVSCAELNMRLTQTAAVPDLSHPSERQVALRAHTKHEFRRKFFDAAAAAEAEALKQHVEAAPAAESEILTSLQDQLQAAVAKNHARVIDLFRAWDEDFSGTIEKKEFQKAIRALTGSKVPKQEIDELFDEFDRDKSGSIDYHELNLHLRRKADIADVLRVGAAGAIELKAKNKHSLHRSCSFADDIIARSKTLSGTVLDVKKSISDQLAESLKASRARINDLFREWDSSGDGRISKAEWRRGMKSLGAGDDPTSQQAVDALFDQVDKDRSGFVDLLELNRSFAPVHKALARRRALVTDSGTKVGVRRQIAGGWQPRQRVLLRPLTASVSMESLVSSSWMSKSGADHDLATSEPAEAETSVDRPRTTPHSSGMGKTLTSLLQTLPPPPEGYRGWTPFERPPRKPERLAMRITRSPSVQLSRLQSSKSSLRRSESSADRLAATLQSDLKWFRSSLADGKLPQHASKVPPAQLLPRRSSTGLPRF